MEKLTCYTNAVNIVGDDALAFDDAVQLGASTMENNGVETDTVEEAEIDGKFVDLVEYGTADFDDCEFCRMRGVGRRGEDTEVAFNFAFGADGIEEASDGILE